MTLYDEGKVTGFIDDATTLFDRADASMDPHAFVWVARMQFDAATMGYAAACGKHLHALWEALGRIGPEPIIVKPDPTVPPPNIRTTDVAEVDLRVTWWLAYFKHPQDHDYWMGVIMDTLYHEGHAIGWTADTYWPDKMRAAYGEPVR